MIDAKELRIGNLVTYNGKEIAVGPSAISELYYLGDTHAKSEIDKREYLPISITEEWLLKFGFERIHHYYCMNDGSMNYHYELKGNKMFMLYFDGRCFAINESKISHREHLSHNKHVHQLQNLWFSVTGKELTYE